MAVGEKTNFEMSLDAMLADLARISRANGFWTDIKTVNLANYTPASDLIETVDPPSLHVWVMESSLSEFSAIGAPRFDATYWIIGTVATDREAQRKLIRLAEDIRGVMYWNPSRTFPGVSASNTWAFTTEDDGVRFYVEEATSGKVGGELLYKWRVVTNTPSPNG